MAIAVLDVGKTNAKVLLLDDAGQVLAQRARPCGTLTGPLYPQLDLDGIWAWAVAALGEIAAIAPVECIVPVAHGAAAVLMAGEELALPALDYEHDGPRFDRRRLGGASSIRSLPQARRCCRWACAWAPSSIGRSRPSRRSSPASPRSCPWPQYWAWRLSGVKATEVTSLGAHTHLWRPARGRFSELARRRGWAERFPPMRRAWDTLGTVRPELAAATGLPADCRVLAGIHDSNASYLPHLVARAPPFTVLSTGTWIIAMAPGLPLAQLDAACRHAGQCRRAWRAGTDGTVHGRARGRAGGRCRGAAHAGDARRRGGDRGATG